MMNLNLTLRTTVTSTLPERRDGGSVRREAGPAKSKRGLTTKRRLALLQRQGADTDRYIIFNIGTISLADAWTELECMLSPEMFKGIASLKKVNSKGLPSRLDMFVTRDVSCGIKQTIKGMTCMRTPTFVRMVKERNPEVTRWRSRPISRWRIDLWKEWRDRPSTAPALTTPTVEKWRDHFMTLNINGLASKRDELTMILLKEQISVCALQETLLSGRAYQVRVPGYTVYTQHWCEGFRGQTLLVRSHLSSYEVGRKENEYIHVKISGLPGVGQPVHVVAVYLPSGGNFRGERSRRVRTILELNRKILRNTPGAPVIIMGDWNMDPTMLQGKLESPTTGLKVYKTKGSTYSRFPLGKKPSAIDHMVVSTGTLNMLRRPRVYRNYGISDHRPLIAELRAAVISEAQNSQPANNWRYDTAAISVHARSLVHDNRWNSLSVDEIVDEEGLTKITGAFIDVMDDISKKLGMKKQKVSGKAKFPRKLKDLLMRRNKAAETLANITAKGLEPSKKVQAAFQRTQKSFKKARDIWNLKENNKFIGYTCRDIRGCDYKKVWARLKEKIDHDGASTALQPVRNKDGVLCVTTEDILQAIADHYDNLANTDVGPSQDAAHWANIDMGESAEEMPTLNDDLMWPQVLLSIRRMKRNTAPGGDGIHINVLKELLNEECMAKVLMDRPGMTRPDLLKIALQDGQLPYEPLTPLGKAFYPILKLTWSLECPPDMWNEVYITNLYKSGDPELMVNYRGISLISVGFKVLLGVMADRLYTAAEDADLIVPEQSGFRRSEEAVAQFLAVAEVVRRRHLLNKPTYAVFVDFKKAFDKVHHEALYRILEHMGVRGRFLNMIKSIYKNSRMMVRAGGRVTNTFGMKRGNRQGCPLSPLLFILFINYLLKEATAGGVTVPGVSTKCSGGLFADDLVALEETSEAAKRFCDNIYKWGQKWGMELGIGKCGVILWSEDEEEKKSHAETTYDTPAGVIPKVDVYKYLGIEMDATLPRSREVGGNEITFAKKQAAKGEKVLNKLRPLLRDRTWPLPVKMALIRTLLLSIMIYGAEWIGYKQLNAAPIQRVIDKALKLAMGNSSRSNGHEAFTLSYELGIPSVEEELASLRARLGAKLKFTTKMKTWLQILYSNPFKKGGNRTWVTEGDHWEKKIMKNLEKYDGNPLRPWVEKGHEYEVDIRSNSYASETLQLLRTARSSVDAMGFESEGLPEGLQESAWGLIPIHYDAVRERTMRLLSTAESRSKKPEEWEHIANIRDCVLERAMETKKSEAFKFYDMWGLGATRGYLRASLCYPELADGVAWLVRIRTRAFPRIAERWQKVKRSGRIPEFSQGLCPLCSAKIENGYEWEHLLLSCVDPKVMSARRTHLSASISHLTEQLERRNDVAEGLTHVVDGDRTLRATTLSRAIAIHLIGGVVNDKFDCDYHVGFGQTTLLPRDLNAHGFVFVVRFLQEVAWDYAKCLFPSGEALYSQDDPERAESSTPSPEGSPTNSPLVGAQGGVADLPPISPLSLLAALPAFEAEV